MFSTVVVISKSILTRPVEHKRRSSRPGMWHCWSHVNNPFKWTGKPTSPWTTYSVKLYLQYTPILLQIFYFQPNMNINEYYNIYRRLNGHQWRSAGSLIGFLELCQVEHGPSNAITSSGPPYAVHYVLRRFDINTIHIQKQEKILSILLERTKSTSIGNNHVRRCLQ